MLEKSLLQSQILPPQFSVGIILFVFDQSVAPKLFIFCRRGHVNKGFVPIDLSFLTLTMAVWLDNNKQELEFSD